jgi:hypothetical protein
VAVPHAPVSTPPRRNRDQLEEQISAAGGLLAVFAGAVAVLFVAASPTASQLASSDPLVQLATSYVGLWGILVASLVPAVVWWYVRPPSRTALIRAGSRAALAFGAVAVGLSFLRLMVGPAFPSFIPPEESARPGMALGLCAALIEEGVFRLGLLAVLYVLWVRRGWSRLGAGLASVVITALALALVHEVGPGAVTFHAQYLVSRFVILGCAMGALFLWPGPAFLVAGHCAAHVGIPLLFPGAAG